MAHPLWGIRAGLLPQACGLPKGPLLPHVAWDKVNDKALTRRAFLLGAAAVAVAVVLPAPAKAVGGASIAGGILRSGVAGTGFVEGCPSLAPASPSWVWQLQGYIQNLAGTANAWLQGWIRNAVGKETYEMFEGWVKP